MRSRKRAPSRDVCGRPMNSIDLLEIASSLAGTYQGLIFMVLICSVRLFVLVNVLAATADQNVLSGVVRNGMVMCMACWIAWGQPDGFMAGRSSLWLAAVVVKEGMIGLALGYAMSTVFWTAEGVGSYLDNLAGFNNVQQTNPSSSTQSTPIGQLLSQLAIASFFMLGGLVSVMSLVLESFQWWPLGQVSPDVGNMMERFASAQVTQLMMSIAKVAGPLLIMLVLIDLGFGLLARAAEKLEANSLAQPVKGATALLMVAFLVSLYFNQLIPELRLEGVAAELRRWVR